MIAPLLIDFTEAGPRRIGLALTAALGVIAVIVLSRGAHRAARAEPIVYVCTETKEMFSAPPQDIPALNPKTGHRTLVRGVYCVACDRWYPAPPTQHQAGNPKALNCPVHKIVMTFDRP